MPLIKFAVVWPTQQSWVSSLSSVCGGPTYLVPFCINPQQDPFIGWLVNSFQSTRFYVIQKNIQFGHVISPGSKLQVAFLLIKRKILDINVTDTLEHSRSHPGVVAIKGDRNFCFVFLHSTSHILVFISTGKDTTIYNDRSKTKNLIEISNRQAASLRWMKSWNSYQSWRKSSMSLNDKSLLISERAFWCARGYVKNKKLSSL